jgi:hypothetical protein
MGFPRMAHVKEIKLGNGKVALIDDEDWPRVYRRIWYAVKAERTEYAATNIHHGGKRTIRLMHRFLMNATDPKVVVDHKNRNGLDNRKENLRMATTAQNVVNAEKKRGKFTSKYKGVSRDGKKWRAQIKINRKAHNLGSYDTEEEAAIVYNERALALWGEFAKLNKVG